LAYTIFGETANPIIGIMVFLCCISSSNIK
jgi:hypothetical protein